MSLYDSNLERRRFIALLGVAGLTSSGISACDRPRRQGPTDTINFTAPSSYDVLPSDWQELARATGLAVRFTDNGNDVGPVLARMKTGTMAQDFDVQGLQGGAEAELAAAQTILPWNTDRIPNWAAVWEQAKSIPYSVVDGKRYGIPIALNADSIIYLADEVRRVAGFESGIIDSYGAVFDAKFAGRASMEDAWINSAVFAAIYLKAQGVSIGDPANLSPSELREVMGFLIDKKRAGQFRRLWRGWEQGVQMLRSREVVVMTGWEPIVKALQAQGMDARYAVPKEGYEGWTNTLVLHAGARDHGRIESAHRFANWLLAGRYGCSLIKLRGYVVPSDSTERYAATSSEFDPTEIAQSVAHVRGKLSGPIYWQNVRPTEFRLYDEWWDRLRNV